MAPLCLCWLGPFRGRPNYCPIEPGSDISGLPSITCRVPLGVAFILVMGWDPVPLSSRSPSRLRANQMFRTLKIIINL